MCKKKPLLALACITALFLSALGMPVPAFSYVLLANGDPSLSFPQKWGPNIWGTGATITWGFMADGVGSAVSGYTGPNTLGTLRTDFDTVHGAGSFDTTVTQALGTWSAVADLTFVQVPEPSGNFGGVTAPDIRIGAFAFDDPCCGGAGFGPPGNSAFPDPLAGDLVLNNQASFTLYPYAEGDPYQPGDFANDLFSILVHELGHTLGLGHPESDGLQGAESLAIMCVDPTCQARTHLRRQLGADDIAGIQFIYGAPVPVPAAIWLFGSGLVGLVGVARRRLANRG